MSICILEDLTDRWNMPVDTYAILVHAPTLSGRQEYAVAWGEPAATLWGGVRPLGWLESQNTSEHGIEWFDSAAAAGEYTRSVTEAVRQGSVHAQ